MEIQDIRLVVLQLKSDNPLSAKHVYNSFIPVLLADQITVIENV